MEQRLKWGRMKEKNKGRRKWKRRKGTREKEEEMKETETLFDYSL